MEVARKEDENWLTKPRAKDRRKIPYHFAKDNVKWLMMISKVMLDSLASWPDHQNKITAIVNFLSIFSIASLVVAQMAYILDKDTDVSSAADAVTGVMSSVEAGGRRLMGVILAKRISKVTSIILYDFWPSDVAGPELHQEINRGSWLLVACMIFESIQAFSWSFQCGMLPLQHHKLSLSSKFWFSYMQSPYYELLYIWESIVCVDLAGLIVGYDLFLLTLIWTCVAQFKLLRKYLLTNFEKAVKRNRVAPAGRRSEALELILVVFQRHNNLIHTCKEIESMLTVYILLLFVGTVGTIVISSFLLTVVKSNVGKAVPFFFGHMIQIFLYCYVGNELILESTALSEAVAHCGWHLLPYDRDLQKSMVLIMVRSQRPVTITVGGFGVLSVRSYLKLLQFCFSVYTLLSSMVRRNDGAETSRF